MADHPRIEELRRRVQKDPASIAFAQLAEEFRRAGQYAEAIDACHAGLAMHPGYLSARVTLGRALIEVGELDQALLELTQVLNAAPENLAALRGLAEIHHRRGDLPQALEVLSLRARVRPQRSRPRAGCRGDLRANRPGPQSARRRRRPQLRRGPARVPVGLHRSLRTPGAAAARRSGTGSAPECAHDGRTAIRKPRPGAGSGFERRRDAVGPIRLAIVHPCCCRFGRRPRAVRRVRALARRVGGASRIRRHRGVTGPGLPSRPATPAGLSRR